MLLAWFNVQEWAHCSEAGAAALPELTGQPGQERLGAAATAGGQGEREQGRTLLLMGIGAASCWVMPAGNHLDNA